MPARSHFLHEPKILLIDDDSTIRLTFGGVLQQSGYQFLEASNGEEGIELALREKPALILLDVQMPKLNGWQTLKKMSGLGLRQPVIMMTGDNAVESRVRGLGAGADDYLGKPCDPRELLARVHAVLRRHQPADRPVELNFGEIIVNLTDHTATKAGAPLALTRTEFAMLEFLARHAGRPVSRQEMLEAVWGYTGASNTRTVETHIWRLRSKLGDNGSEAQWIRTVPAVGYALDRATVQAAEPALRFSA